MPPDATAQPAAQSLLNECVARLNDPTRTIDEMALRRYVRELQAALKDAPGDMPGLIYGALGSLWFRLKDFQRSVDAYQNAIRLSPRSIAHEINLATLLLSLGRTDEASERIERARSKPSEAVDRILLAFLEGRVHQARAETVAVRSAFERALRLLDPTDPGFTLRFAVHAAIFEYDNDAAEFLARHLVLVSSGGRGDDETSIEVIQRHADSARPILSYYANLSASVARVLARWDAPMPREHEARTHIDLAPEAWATLCQLAEVVPEA